MKRFSGLFISILLLMWISPIEAQPFRGTGGDFYSGLGLTSSQIDKITDLRISFQEETLPLRNKLQTSLLELRRMYFKGEGLDRENARRSEITRIQQELDNLYLDYQGQVRALLTEEQRLIFDRWGASGGALGFGNFGGYGFRGGRGRGFGAGWNASPGIGLGPGAAMGPGRGIGTGRAWGAGPARGWRCPGRGYRW